MQKGWIGHRAINSSHYGLKCLATIEVEKTNTGSLTNISKSVPQTTGENPTLLELQWPKRKGVKRIVKFGAIKFHGL